MIRCSTCGRNLAGQRYDHPILCRTWVALEEGRPAAAQVAVTVAKVQIHEGSTADPFNMDHLAGPIERGLIRRSRRAA